MQRSAEGQLQGEVPADAADQVQVQRQHEEKDSGDQSWKEMKTSLGTAVSSASIIYTLLFCDHLMVEIKKIHFLVRRENGTLKKWDLNFRR